MAITQEKAERIAQEYAKVGYKDKTSPLLAMGYSKSYAQTLGHKLYNNIKVIEAIERLRVKVREVTEHTQQIALELLAERLLWSNKGAKKGNIQAIQAQTAIIREMDAITGLHSQTIHTSEQDKLPELTEAEKVIYKRTATELTLLSLNRPQKAQESA